MDLNKTYNNRKLEARRKQILQQREAEDELRAAEGPPGGRPRADPRGVRRRA